MRKIYQKAKRVLTWLGDDTPLHQAKAAVELLLQMSSFLCEKLGISISDLRSFGNLYEELILMNRKCLPLPNECDLGRDVVWSVLIWFYSHSYFKRLWVIQELSANKERLLLCGNESIEWDRIELVAGYLVMEPSFSNAFGFANTHCWWVITIPELSKRPTRWLSMLYLASNYSAVDARDVIYGLRGLMELSNGAELLYPDYTKPTIDVFRDSVEAAFISLRDTNVLLYLRGNEKPSWIPRWDRPMLFRNPFRFGKMLPWRPAGDIIPTWTIDKSNVLFLSGRAIDSVRLINYYNEIYFNNNMIRSHAGKAMLKQAWQRILTTMGKRQSQLPLQNSDVTAAAISFSFGLDEHTDPGDERHLSHNFAAYLKIVLDEDTFNKHISPDLSDESKQADGYAFGKPTWDFEYPESSFFITQSGLFGCAISKIMPGDLICLGFGCAYPLILRPDGHRYLLKGHAYVHGIMYGERRHGNTQVFEIH